MDQEEDNCNRITGHYSAIINGRSTSLEGCNNEMCPHRNHCIRQSKKLFYRVDFALDDYDNCEDFLSNKLTVRPIY